MTIKLCWLLIFYSFNEVASLLCYNCTSTHRDRKNCGGDFTPADEPFVNDRQLLVNCTGDGAMCFVRSWTARARYAWMVQRGCYLANKDDPIPRSMTTPTRAMSCRNERFVEAEYKVCFCQADWCNSTHLLQVKSFAIVVFCLVALALI
ncbi:uncharacterized protein LOC114363029 [Ostrinia furnacalis]|uniref:uncharacterized protein LOC114363029 n=1 Tax=Ostrinia furnacalis TaxID=93504 RepID=UPI00103CFD15|nr:uncharacterized protein LOC114363029 [Ostrinia furnacalis]